MVEEGCTMTWPLRAFWTSPPELEHSHAPDLALNAKHCAESGNRSFTAIGEKEWQVDEVKWNIYQAILWFNQNSFCMYLAPAFPKTLGSVFDTDLFKIV